MKLDRQLVNINKVLFGCRHGYYLASLRAPTPAQHCCSGLLDDGISRAAASSLPVADTVSTRRVNRLESISLKHLHQLV